MNEKAPYARIAAFWLVWRMGLVLVGWFATAWFPPMNLQNQPLSWMNVLAGVWGNWDGTWYYQIADVGYGGALAAHHNEIIFNFFPLYPWLGGLVGLVLGPLLGLLVVSNLASLLACFVLYRLARFDTDDAGADRAVTMLLVYPFAFFLGAAYTESLFLLFSLLAFLEARKERWLRCALFGALTCLTRHVGVVLVPALALELVLRKRRLTRELLYLLIIPMGMLVYFLYLQLAFGNFWLFFKAQASSVPIRHLSPWLWEPITHQLPVLFGNPFVPKFVIGWIEVLSVLAAFVCGALVWKRWRPSYGLYTTLAVIPPLASGLTTGMTRYLVVLFPIFLLLGGRGPERPWQRNWMLVSAMLLSLFAVLFTRVAFVG